ncbi:MAG: hypothetical protein CVU56_19650 [Deltaproteobacteria bacterium HGW-Deltaproteobacteria-14]|jgi:hypothetical protein|nr:MAG: hypothetical protein CVU56_19650 [Deltaproteobacteria bacterium HGW-Deltaproteobacteria-14]
MPRPHTPTRLLVTAVALTLAGCSRTPAPQLPPDPTQPGPTESTATEAADTAAVQADAAEATTAAVIAQVGARTISADEVTAVVDLLVREGKLTPGPQAVRSVLDKLIADAVVAEEARAEGFDESAIARQTRDAALAALYLDQKTRAEAEGAVTDEDVNGYWGPRRLATKLVVASRDVASALQIKILEAIATTPDKAAEIFADFRSREALTGPEGDAAATTPFDRAGRGPVGEPVAHENVALAAFGLTEVGAVAPPVELGPGRWALVQLVAMRPGTAPEALTPEQKEQARAALVAARATTARAALLARLRDKAEVRVDDAQLAELVASLVRLEGRQRGRAAIDLQKLRAGRLRQLPSRIPPGMRRPQDMRRGTPEGDEHRPPPRPIHRRPPMTPSSGDASP